MPFATVMAFSGSKGASQFFAGVGEGTSDNLPMFQPSLWELRVFCREPGAEATGPFSIRPSGTPVGGLTRFAKK
jgi:hypothetical protein